MNLQRSILRQWVVIGAGPSGVTYLTQLLSLNVKPENILWVDSEFNGGAFHKYRDVPGNTKVKGFMSWALGNSVMKTLASDASDPLKELKSIDIENTCGLSVIHNILLNYTNQLKKIVPTKYGKVKRMEYNHSDSYWSLFINESMTGDKSDNQQSIVTSTNVCLTTGCVPQKHTNLHIGLRNKRVISLEDALSLEYLKANIRSGETVAIVGGSHSAFVIMYLLDQFNIPNLKIVNAYRGEVRYAEYKKDFILYDNTGLKGIVAEWAREILEGRRKPNFHFDRINVDIEEDKLSRTVPSCSSFIYAHGFARCPVSEIIYKLPEACGYDDKTDIRPNIVPFMDYSNVNGKIIVPCNNSGCRPIEGLYGFGFAFPEKIITRIGEMEYHVGLAKFALCAEKWLKHTKL